MTISANVRKSCHSNVTQVSNIKIGKRHGTARHNDDGDDKSDEMLLF